MSDLKLFVVEIEDNGQWPMPTVGPFYIFYDAVKWIARDIQDEYPGMGFKVSDYDGSEIARSYALNDGSTYYHIKRLQSPE